MTSFNKYHCMSCGEPVPKENVVWMGNSRIWICDRYDCNMELEGEERAMEEDVRQRAEEDDYSRYR